jgi:hypothetical protein
MALHRGRWLTVIEINDEYAQILAGCLAAG